MSRKLLRGIGTAVVAGAIAATTLVSFAGPASAVSLPGSKTVVIRGGGQVATCTFTANSYNAATNQLRVTLHGTVRPSTVGGYLTTASSFIYCEAFGDYYWVGYASGGTFVNGPVSSFYKSAVVDWDASFAICGQGSSILRSGTTTTTGYDCKP